MDIQNTKLNLIQWLAQIQNVQVIKAIQYIQKNEHTYTKKRQFGFGKHLILNISDDFDEPLDAFNDYLK